MFCRNCGQQIKEGAKFCTKCGMPAGQVNLQKNRQQQSTQMQPSQASSGREKKGGKGILIALICILIAVCAVAAGVLGYQYMSAQSEDGKSGKRQRKEEVSETEIATETELPAETELPVEAKVPDKTPAEISREEVSEIPEKEPETNQVHEYRIVVKDVTWTEAFQKASSVPNGHLLIINSDEEWNTVIQQIYAEKREECIFWIGATRRGNSSDYFWVDAYGNNLGEPLNDSLKWLTGEPTYYDEENDMEEYYVDMFFSSGENRWVWNDTPNDLISLISYYSGRVAYIVEIEP